MSINIDHTTNNISLDAGSPPTLGGTSTQDSFGWIYHNGSPNGTTQSSIGSPGSPSLVDFNITGSGNGSPSVGVTPDYTTSKLTTTTSGDYKVSAELSFVGSTSTVYNLHIAVNGTDTEIGSTRSYSSGTPQTGSTMLSGFLTLASSDEVTITVNADASGKSINIAHGALILEKLIS